MAPSLWGRHFRKGWLLPDPCLEPPGQMHQLLAPSSAFTVLGDGVVERPAPVQCVHWLCLDSSLSIYLFHAHISSAHSKMDGCLQSLWAALALGAGSQLLGQNRQRWLYHDRLAVALSMLGICAHYEGFQTFLSLAGWGHGLWRTEA